MKTLMMMMMALLTVGFSSNAMAQPFTDCHQFAKNGRSGGYTQLCLTVETYQASTTPAKIELYKGEKIERVVMGELVHTPQERICGTDNGQPYCYRKYEARKILAETESVSVDVHLHKSRLTCLNGTVKLKVTESTVIELTMDCPSLSRGGGGW